MRSLHDRLVYPSNEAELSAAANEAWAEIQRLQSFIVDVHKTFCDCGALTKEVDRIKAGSAAFA